MKKLIKGKFSGTVLLGVLFFAAGCGSREEDSPPNYVVNRVQTGTNSLQISSRAAKILCVRVICALSLHTTMSRSIRFPFHIFAHIRNKTATPFSVFYLCYGKAPALTAQIKTFPVIPSISPYSIITAL